MEKSKGVSMLDEVEALIKRLHIKKSDDFQQNQILNTFMKHDQHAYLTYKHHHNLRDMLVKTKYIQKTDAQREKQKKLFEEADRHAQIDVVQ